MNSIYIQAFKNIPKTYLFALPIVLINVLPTFKESTSMTINIVTLLGLMTLFVLGQFYKHYLITKSTNKTIKIKNSFKYFKNKFSNWIRTIIRAILKISKWILPIIISFAIFLLIITLSFDPGWSNYFFQEPFITRVFYTLLLINIYFGYKTITQILKLYFSVIISIDQAHSPQENIKMSEQITHLKLKTLLKAIVAIVLVGILSINISFIADLSFLETASTIEKLLKWQTYFFIAMINIANTYSINLIGLVYKQFKK